MLYFLLQCNGNYAIAGFYSDHSNGHEDRRIQLLCRRFHCTCIDQHCHRTGALNDFTGNLALNLADGYFLRGIWTDYNNDGTYSDRRFAFYYCKARECC